LAGKNSASGVEKNGSIAPTCFRRRSLRLMGLALYWRRTAGENRPGAVAVELVLQPQFMHRASIP